VATASRASAPQLLATLLLCGLMFVPAAFAVSNTDQDRPRRDEFGVIPEDAVDKDLSLPDPILDRNWPAPRPGDKVLPPAEIAPDEGDVDPFDEDIAPTRPPTSPPPGAPSAPARPNRPLVGPDGKYDAGTPVPEPDPAAPIEPEPEINEPSEVDEEDNAPSPLDRDDQGFEQEMNDPGDW